MDLYQISDLEKLTGIKAHTIRIWEQRYNLIKPKRTLTNIRRYDNEQVKKLLNVTTLLSKGYKISKIANLSNKEIHQEIIRIQESNHTDSVRTIFINNLIISMLAFDEQAFEKAYSAVVTRFGLLDATSSVFYPLLYKIGVMWSVNHATPIQEHFISSILTRKLMAATDGLPLPTRKSKKFILLLPPNEFHEIGLLFANYIIRSKGYETVYLGANVPYEHIEDALKHTHSNYLMTFFMGNQNTTDVVAQVKKYISCHKHIISLISGPTHITNHIKQKKNLYVLSSPNDLLTYL